MKAVKRVVAMVLCAMLALSVLGCSLKDDPNQAVATVNGAKITKGEFNTMVDQFTSFYSQFGMDPSTDPSLQADVMNSALETLVQNLVLEQKAKELGFDKVTIEQAKADIPKFSPELADYMNNFLEQAKSEGAADVQKRADELMLETVKNAGMTEADFEKQLLSDYKQYKLEQSVKETVTVTDEEVKAWYDTNVTKQTEDLKTNPIAFEQYDDTNPALFIPEGYVTIKQIFLKPADDASVSTKLSDFDTKMGETATKMADLLKEGKDKNSTEFVVLEAELAKLRADSAAARDAWLAPAKAKADEVYAKVTAGGDFQALIDEYNEDPGMKTEPIKSRGYYVGKDTNRFVQPFKDAALALANVGDVSPIVASDMGFHILKLAEKVKSGVVPFDSVKDLCKAKALEEKQNSAYDAKVKEWTAAAKVVKYNDKLNIPDVAPAAPAASEAPAQ